MPYIRGASKQTEQQLAVSIRDTKKECARLARQLQGIQTELEALRKARDIINQAHRDARVIREQAYDFGLAQLDRDYPTRQHRNRERLIAKTKLVKRYARDRLKAAFQESTEWDARQKDQAA